MSVLLLPEFRLLYAVLLNALAFGASWRLARRWNDDGLRATADAFLLFYLVQYLSICLPGLVGALHPATLALVALLLGSVMLAAGMRTRDRLVESPPMAIGGLGRATVIACALFLIGYLGALIWHQRNLPVISNDALTYHLPAAVQWLATGRLGLYESWYYNPANSYSPLGGSAYVAWLIAPFGNDVIARYVAVGPLIFLFFAMLNLCRSLGASGATASVLALAAVLVRPFVSQTILAKDDLFVAAYFVMVIDAMARLREVVTGDLSGDSRERKLRGSRPRVLLLGIALGLLLATKYTALMSMPLLLLMLGRGWTWRRVTIVTVVTLSLAGPWYLRNAILTGNPLFPTKVTLFGAEVFPGLLELQRSELLTTFTGVWHVFTGSYYAIPVTLALILLAGWIAACVFAIRQRRFDALARTCTIGPVLGIAIFILTAPYGEMRFAYPSLLLLIASSVIALKRLPDLVAIIVAGIVVILAGLTAFPIFMTTWFLITGAALAATAFAIGGAVGLAIHWMRLTRRVASVAAILLLTTIAMAVYVHWSAYVELGKSDSVESWAHADAYPGPGEVWRYVRTEIPTGATIAYANTYFTYPLMGYSYDHRVVYAPTRRGLERFVDLPPIPRRVTGEQIVGEVIAQLRQDPDKSEWLRRLRDSGAEYLVLFKIDPSMPKETANPPEMNFVAQEPTHFQRVFDGEIGSVFKIVW